MSNNLTRIAAQFKQKQDHLNATWHNDFFASLSNQAFVEPSLSYTEGADMLGYTAVQSMDNVTSSWSNYARAAKSKGIIPDYTKFVETYQTIKKNRSKKLLNQITQLQQMHAGDSDFNRSLNRTLLNNEELRLDLMKAARDNPEDPASLSVLSALSEAAKPWEERVMGEVGTGVNKVFNPLDNINTMGRTALRGALLGPGAYKTAQKGALKTGGRMAATMLLPGYASAGRLRGMAGYGPYKGLKAFGKGSIRDFGAATTRKNILSPWVGKKVPGQQRKLFLKAVSNERVNRKALQNLANLSLGDRWKLDKAGKPLLDKAGKKIPIKGSINWNSKTGKLDYLNKLDSQLDDALKNASKLKKADPKLYNSLVQQKRAVSQAILQGEKKGGKIATKSVIQNMAKESTDTGAKALTQVVKKKGWGAIVKKLGWKTGAKVLAKLVGSGIMKAGGVFTAGATTLLSLGLDAWMLKDIYDVAKEIAKEWDTETTYTTKEVEEAVTKRTVGKVSNL